jgi:hypothetical protein
VKTAEGRVGRRSRNRRRPTYSTAPLTSRTNTRVGRRSSTQVGQAPRPAVNPNCGGHPAMRPTPRRGLLGTAAQTIVRPGASDQQKPSPTRRRARIDGNRAGPVRVDGVGAMKERRLRAASPLRHLADPGLDTSRWREHHLSRMRRRSRAFNSVTSFQGAAFPSPFKRPSSRRARLGPLYRGLMNSAGYAAG